ncbi:hypothetical protein [Streptomyces sp. NPDC085596]|uniref:hypothetical protein n=1 Tax=Streptomyces sp. NPDC085596 TaxID=3365731 RepID=UPI0037D60894
MTEIPTRERVAYIIYWWDETRPPERSSADYLELVGLVMQLSETVTVHDTWTILKTVSLLEDGTAPRHRSDYLRAADQILTTAS